MMRLAEYRARPAALADYLPWAGLVAPGVVLNKDGSFQRSARFRGPDLESSAPGELVSTVARINNALRRLGSGWALFVEAVRHEAGAYPASSFDDALAWLVDEERRAAFEEAGSHYGSGYVLTLLYLPAGEGRSRLGRWLFESGGPKEVNWREQLDAFVVECDRIFGLLQGLMPELAWLDDSATLTYLHGTLSPRDHRIDVPEVPFHLDGLLADAPLTGGFAPMLGSDHLRVVSVRGFPASTWPGMLDDLNRLDFPCRWMTRFLFLDKPHAEHELVKVRRQWFAKRKSIVTLLRETVFQQESPLLDPDATNKAADADAALEALGSDAVSFGYVTSTVVVSHSDAATADERAKAIERVIQGRGFVTVRETLNAVEAWLSSLPGHVYANVRQAPVSTLNLAHLMPLSAVWSGPERNAHLDGAPLMVTRTEGSTPFRLVTHVGDVGHTLVVGPTGAGKSVLLAMLAMQFRRYPGSRVFAFDKGRSLRAAILGLGGEHYELAQGEAVAFQPLANIDADDERTWAAEWTGVLLAHEGIEVTPEVRDAVWSALQSLASAPREQRTLTGLSALLQSNRLRQGLQPYTLAGPYGGLLDAERERLGQGSVQCFEMEELMHARSVVLPVLTYLFHKLESRFDGAPTLLVIDEAWVFLDDPAFASRLREWLKTLRRRNVAVMFATQSLADIERSSIAAAVIESCPSRIFLPAPQALEPQMRRIYESFGLVERQIELIARATPRRDYYFQSRLGNRLFDLDLRPIALAFAGASRPDDQREIDRVLREVAPSDFATAWLRTRHLGWAADLLAEFPLHREERP